MVTSASDSLEKLEDMIVRAAETTAAHVRAAKDAIGGVIFGQDKVVEQALITVLSGGHALLVGVPGLAKTKLVETMGVVLGLDARRIQFTPDLMPSDILGTEVLEESPGGKRNFRFIPGPVFAQLLMADEINRASPRTQSALLQAMQELHVTVAGSRHDVPKPFHVLATQNPLEQEGTYPLPEAQLDRFLLKIRVAYPSEAEERQILERHHAGSGAGLLEDARIEPIPASLLAAARAEVHRIRIEPELYNYLLTIVRRTREWPAVLLGASPRAAVNIMLVAQAAAAFDGRDYLVPDDVKRAVLPVLRHRVMLKPEAELEGYDADRALADVIAAVPVPRQ